MEKLIKLSMTLSNLIEIFTILIAVFAIIPSKNRRLVFLKFSTFDRVVLIAIFIFVNYLFAFDWFVEKIPSLSYFICDKSIYPEVWAYLISVCTLIWIIWKMLKSYFPKSNFKKVKKYYNYLLTKDVDFLAELIEQYHKSDVSKYLRAIKKIEFPNIIPEEDAYKQYNTECNKATKKKHKRYGGLACGIIYNDVFVNAIVNKNPYLFSDVIQELNTKNIKDKDFVNHFLKVLTRDKNSDFFKEIRNNQNGGKYGSYRIEKERPILYALFNDANVALINEAWSGIGEQAILEMEDEARKSYSPLRNAETEQDEDTKWGYMITNAIHYFDIMVRCSIVQNINDHMCMYYYSYFEKGIISNMKSDQNRGTRNFDLIERIIKHMMKWKDVCVESTNYELIPDIYSCIIQCICGMFISDKLINEDKIYLINLVWEDLIKTVSEKRGQEENIENLIDTGFDKFKNPMLFCGYIKNEYTKMEYLRALNYMYNNRDKTGLTNYNDRVMKFKREVLDKMEES